MSTIRIKRWRRLWRNPVATCGGRVVADIRRIRVDGLGRVWEATLRPYADNLGPDQCPVGVVHGVGRRHLKARLNDRLNRWGEWWV
jgi:hypothetical protein